MKVYLEPQYRKPDHADGGLRRVIEAQIKYLPRYGVEIVKDINKADLTAGHIAHAPIVEGKPYVEHCHGLMWACYSWAGMEWVHDVNRDVTNALKQAQAITVPSRWVAHAITRGMLRTPHVIYHGIDADEWAHNYASQGYVLWNKARADDVSNPADMQRVAELLQEYKFVATIGKATTNVRVAGVKNYKAHKPLVQQAAVYLATARETFGIGTLEAMASGVPVAGWDYGGQSEIIIPGETGYLAPYGNYPALADAIKRCMTERERLSQNCIADARARWGWPDKIEQYATLYGKVMADWNAPRPKVSIIVTCHNLGKFLTDALSSVLHQSMGDWECVIVDDDSKDFTPDVAKQFTEMDARFVYLKTPENLKLSRALNFGHEHSRGRYVMNLDADNILPGNALALLSDALDKRRDLHVVYGALDTMNEDGTNRRKNDFPYPIYDNFSWYGQMAHLNQLHSSAMMRREVMEQSGGYRERQFRAEDAEFWCRASSFGFKIERVTTDPTVIYRLRGDSKSIQERHKYPDIDGDWCEYFPWRTAKTAELGKAAIAKNAQAVKNTSLVPFGAQGQRPDGRFWDVYHHQEPLVSVIIPVGPGHRRYVVDALDSLVGQTMNEWEAIVVNDTGDDWDTIAGAPYARIFKTRDAHGAGAAKNEGLKHAKGAFVFFLDADDMIAPDTFVKMLHRYALGDTSYVYCDARVPADLTTANVVRADEYVQFDWLKKGVHAQTVLMATEDARRVGGFNEGMRAWEDWDFFVKCAISGLCGARHPEAVLTYRKHLGQRSTFGHDIKQELFKELRERYVDYTRGAKKMAKCCGGNKAAMDRLAASRAIKTHVESVEKPVPLGYTRLKYIGRMANPVTYHVGGRAYTAANTPKWAYVDALNEDVSRLIQMSVFTKAAMPLPPAPLPAPPPVAAPPAPPVAPEPPKPAPVVTPAPKPVVSASAMEAAVKAMEQKTHSAIQPKAKDSVSTATPSITVTQTVEPPKSVPIATAEKPEPKPKPVRRARTRKGAAANA